MKRYNEIVALFEQANTKFLSNDINLLETKVSERTLCGALMLHLHDIIINDPSYNDYYADVEYNRNKGALKTVYKTIQGPRNEVIRINCDLIVHSRGGHPEQDNLLAVEMKKSSRSRAEKGKDKARLMVLTRKTFDDSWSFDGTNLPEHVCRYVLGVYYEINYKTRAIYTEYYKSGILCKTSTISY